MSNSSVSSIFFEAENECSGQRLFGFSRKGIGTSVFSFFFFKTSVRHALMLKALFQLATFPFSFFLQKGGDDESVFISTKVRRRFILFYSHPSSVDEGVRVRVKKQRENEKRITNDKQFAIEEEERRSDRDKVRVTATRAPSHKNTRTTPSPRALRGASHQRITRLHVLPICSFLLAPSRTWLSFFSIYNIQRTTKLFLFPWLQRLIQSNPFRLPLFLTFSDSRLSLTPKNGRDELSHGSCGWRRGRCRRC